MESMALQSSAEISHDIFPSVYDWFFTEEAFVRWRKDRMTWPLHCIGGPGAGKVNSRGSELGLALIILIDDTGLACTPTPDYTP